jgi:hypothetical protein
MKLRDYAEIERQACSSAEHSRWRPASPLSRARQIRTSARRHPMMVMPRNDTAEITLASAYDAVGSEA